MNTNYVLQQNNFDCGIAALKTIFLQFGKKIKTEDITNSNINQGITALNLIKASKKMGLDAKGVKTDLLNLDNSYLPCIAHVIKDKSYFHYIVILKNNKTKKNLTVMDPAVGIINMSYQEFMEITTNVFIIFNKKKLVKEKDTRFKTFLISIMKQNKLIIIKTLLFSCLVIILSLVFSYYLRIILEFKSLYLKISLIFLFLLIIKNIFEYIKNKSLITLNKNIDKTINNSFISHIFHLPYDYFLSKTTGEVITLTNDIENFKDIVTKIFILCFMDLVFILGMLIFISFYNIYYLYIFIILTLITLLLSIKYQSIFNNNYVKLKLSKIINSSQLIESIEGYNSIKNLAIEEKTIEKLYKNYDNTLNNSYNYNACSNEYNLFNNIIVEIFYIMVILLSINILPLLDIVLFSSVFYLYIGFLNNINDNISYYKLYNSSINNVLDCFYIKEEKISSKMITFNNIVFDKVTFKYNNNIILNSVSFNLKKGDRILITGKSGVGKSTLIKILLKHLTHYDGNITVDRINLKYIEKELIKNSITYISQEEKLFNDTIYNNLKIVNDDKKEIDKVINICEINTILKNNNSKNYVITENGKNLSGGERQKILIARSLLKKSNMIIFDESFNGIDSKTERKILKNIINSYKNITIIFISHIEKNKDLFNKKYRISKTKMKEELI